jgi:aryl-alcohol dehydrogenase-like predicted oxidoreductase
MRTRRIGDVQVSAIGLGGMPLSIEGRPEEQQAVATIHAALDAGITLIDTADAYSLGGDDTGHNESLIARAVSTYGGDTSDVIIATKGGHLRPGDGSWTLDGSPEYLRQAAEASLKRLGVEALDLTQLHCVPTEHLKRGDVFDWLATLQKEGKVRHWGASVESMAEAMLCVRRPGIASLQIIFNVFRQKPLSELFGEARHRGVALIVRLPLASGLLSGKMARDTSFAPTDHRNYNRDGQQFNVGETFAGLRFEKGVELADALKPLVPPSMTMAQMALRWCLDFEGVTAVIPGARSPQQAKENAAVSNARGLSDELHERLRTFYLDRVAAHIRGPY